eukprot:1154672-Pelagomonas_calceolata.AAC.4
MSTPVFIENILAQCKHIPFTSSPLGRGPERPSLTTRFRDTSARKSMLGRRAVAGGAASRTGTAPLLNGRAAGGDAEALLPFAVLNDNACGGTCAKLLLPVPAVCETTASCDGIGCWGGRLRGRAAMAVMEPTTSDKSRAEYAGR